jgi:gamma-glutamyl hercynylcysteine S-oxide synthase
VCQLSQGRIHREANISLFNGYGVELNSYYPGRPEWVEEELLYLGKIVKVLRENSVNFNSYDWTPLLPATTDSIWVNHFPSDNKDIYTIYSLIPEGFSGPLFKADIPTNHHAVSLWHHEEVPPDTIDGKVYPEVNTRAFDRSWTGTRRESAVDVIAVLPKMLSIERRIDSLFVDAAGGKKIVISAGNPTYQSEKIELAAGNHALKLYDHFGGYEGKIVVQLFDENDQLLDERITGIPLALPRLISETEKTIPAGAAPEGMKEIPAGTFVFKASNPDQFIPYPKNSEDDTVKMQAFFMDEYPVTNAAFAGFLQDSKYKPTDENNFLKHWPQGTYQDSLAKFPVVFVSPGDASAYCKYYQKRLPTEAEWQYSAQGPDGRAWPWGNEFDSTLCNNALGFSTSVDRYPQGASPFGVKDMVGNVWQLTADTYDNGSYYYTIMKGGSFYKPASSWWYVKGGPQPVYHQQMLLRVYPGFDRNATVGFRCVKDGGK